MCGTVKQILSLRDVHSHKPRFRGTHSRGHGVIPYHERPFCPTSPCQLFRWVSACTSPVATYFDCHLWPILTPNTNKPRCPSGLQRDELKQKELNPRPNSIALGEYVWKRRVKQAGSTQAVHSFSGCSLGTELASRYSAPRPLSEAVPTVKDFNLGRQIDNENTEQGAPGWLSWLRD